MESYTAIELHSEIFQSQSVLSSPNEYKLIFHRVIIQILICIVTKLQILDSYKHAYQISIILYVS